jgi:hypothetical protein
VADAGDALAGCERLIESAEAASINTAARQNAWTALEFHDNRILPTTQSPKMKPYVDGDTPRVA